MKETAEEQGTEDKMGIERIKAPGPMPPQADDRQDPEDRIEQSAQTEQERHDVAAIAEEAGRHREHLGMCDQGQCRDQGDEFGGLGVMKVHDGTDLSRI